MMKKLVALVLVLAMGIPCAFAVAEPVKIGIVTPDADHGFTGESVKHTQAELDALVESMGKEGLEYRFETGDTPEAQAAKIEEILAWEPDVILLWPTNGQALQAAAEGIIAQGVGLILYDRLIEGLQGYDAEIMGDNETIGEWMGSYILTYFADCLAAGETLQYLLFTGDSSTVTEQRAAGMAASLAASDYESSLEKVQAFRTDWSSETAREQMTQWLSTATPEEVLALDFIVTHDDEIVDGVMLALEDFGGAHGIKLITGVGGRRETLDAFDESTLGIDLVTYFFSPSMIREAIRLAVLDAQGEPYEGEAIDGQLFLIPPVEIDKDTVDDYRNSQAYADRYSVD